MIIISYDPTGKPLTIHIKIGDIWAQIPFNSETKVIDWGSIDNPTEKSIMSKWNEWAQDKNLEYELRDRSDLATPRPEPIPDWNALKFAFLTNSGYQRVTLQTTAVLAVTRLETAVVDYVGGMQPTYQLFKTFWDAIIDGLSLNKPTVLEIASWNAIALSTHMKFSFGADGKMLLAV